MPVNNVWGQLSPTEEITLPSGQTVIAKKLGMHEVLAAGLSSELDILTPFVRSQHLQPQDHKAKGQADIDINEIMKDPKAISGLLLLVDRIVPEAVVQPEVRCHYVVLEDGKTTKRIPEGERESGVTYTDKLPFEDKMYIFQWTSGEGDLNPISFREESQRALADVADSQAVQSPSQRNPRRRRR